MGNSVTFASAKALMTLMRASSERLMLAPSLSRSPLVLATDGHSEPARSIRLILATFRPRGRLPVQSCCFTWIWKDREG